MIDNRTHLWHDLVLQMVEVLLNEGACTMPIDEVVAIVEGSQVRALYISMV